jgi:hypothetical protein
MPGPDEMPAVRFPAAIQFSHPDREPAFQVAQLVIQRFPYTEIPESKIPNQGAQYFCARTHRRRNNDPAR